MTISLVKMIHASSNVASPQQWRQRGAGYLEFALVTIIFAILTGILLHKVQFYQDEAERLAAEQVVTSLRSALASRAASLYLRGNEAEIAALERQNPIDWLDRRPPNYAGEFYAPKPGTIPPGQWYFDRTTTTLSYLLNKREYFIGSDSKRLNFKVKFARNPSTTLSRQDGPGPGGVTLEQIDD